MRLYFKRNYYFLKELCASLGQEGLEVCEIGDGILAIRKAGDENFDVYFDTGRWRLTIEVKESYRLIIFPPALMHSGVIPGRLIKGGVKTREMVITVVRAKLIPTAPHYELVPERKEDLFSFFGGPGDIFDIFKDFFDPRK